MGRATAQFFCPVPWGPGEGPKGQLSLNLNYISINFKDFLAKYCVSSHKKMISEIQPNLVLELLKCMAHAAAQFFWVPNPFGLGKGPKRSNIIQSQLQSQFQRFLKQTLCVFSQMKNINHIRRDFHSVAWVMPKGWGLGYRGGGGQKVFFFSEIQPELVGYLHDGTIWGSHSPPKI